MAMETATPAATAPPLSSTPTSNGNGSKEPIKTLKRACDCCRKRKVKCDGSEPCGPCKKASIRCAYLQPPRKKGPKGLRSARVLHALRTIDDAITGSPTNPLSPEHHAVFGIWQWEPQRGPPTGIHYADPTLSRSNEAYGHQTSIAPDQNCFQPHQSSTSMPVQAHPQQHPTHRPPLVRLETQQPWTSHWKSVNRDMPSTVSSAGSEPTQHRLHGESFFPYVRLFFAHMFPIMPIIDRTVYQDPLFYLNSSIWSSDVYCFLCAISAATIVQLDASIPQPPPLHPCKPTDDLFAEECFRERRTFDYIESTTPTSVMTSFFLFAYYGNHEKHAKAWHYLQESITLAENLDMDNERWYAKLDPVLAQWHRRLYWLLFITERAYAVQRRKRTRLHASVQLPAVFESEDPQLLNGFVNLANLFSTVDDSFVSAWRGSRRASLCDEAWLAQMQKQLDATAMALETISETQNVDISVTREWLHVLAWQMGVSNGLLWSQGEGAGGMRLEYPIELARRVVAITTGARAPALDAHGIGMEQKLSDMAGCLADVLKCTAGDTSVTFLEGKEYLNILLQQLSSMRGKESRYLQPLMNKIQGLTGYELSNQTLPLPTESVAGGYSEAMANMAYLGANTRLSMMESGDMLRTLSISSALGMPGLNIPQETWQQHRPSGTVYDETKTKAIAGQERYMSDGFDI